MINRRAFLKFAFRSLPVPFLASSTVGCKRRPEANAPRNVLSLETLEEHSVDVISRDFGRLVERIPRGSYANLSLDKFSTLLRHARDHRLPVRLQGNRHTSNGQSLCSGGYTATLTSGEDILQSSDDSTETVVVAASSSWHDVSSALASTSRNVAVYTDNLQTTVGGTLAVGGIGVASVQHGTQIDQVVGFDLITPEGELLSCSVEENREFFRLVPGALGSLGWMTNVSLKVIPRNQTPRCQTMRPCPDLPQLLDSIQSVSELEEWPAEMRWNLTSTGGFVSLVHRHDSADSGCTPTSVETNEREVGERANSYLAEFPGAARVWCDFLVPAGRYGEFLSRHGDSWFSEADSRKTLLGSVAVCSQTHHPLAPNYSARPRMFFSAGVYTFLSGTSAAIVEEIRAEYDAMTESCLELGGRVYRHGYSPNTERFLRAQFQDSMSELRDLSRSVDPDGIAWNEAWGDRDA